MGRGLWFVAGAGAGVYAVVRARRAAEVLTADGLRDRVGAAVVGARIFRDEIAQGRADAETRLRGRLDGALHGGAPSPAALPTGGRHRAGPTPSTDHHDPRDEQEAGPP